jgi:recombination protein RecT
VSKQLPLPEQEKREKLKMANEIVLINPKTIGTELEKFIPQMERALPRHMTADRMARIALTSLRVNPKLMNCSRDSFYGSLMAASQLGLEPGINGQCYLIPYGNVCTLVPGWRGYMDLVNRTERATASTEAVYDGDEFDYTLGTKVEIRHKRGKWSGNESALQYVYAVGHIKGLEEFPQIDVWDIDKIWAHRNKQNKVGDRHYSYVHPEMYARKIPLLQVIKYLPSSIELTNASALDAAASEGNQSLTIDMALKGELEQGGDISTPSATDPLEGELDALFANLGSNPSQQRMLRESYAGRTQELVTHLKGRLAPEVQTKPTPPATQTATTPVDSAAIKLAETQATGHPVQDKPAATQEAPAGEVKRGRGRPSREEMARRRAAEEAATGQQTLTPSDGEETAPVYFPANEDPAQQDEDDSKQEDVGGSAFDLV